MSDDEDIIIKLKAERDKRRREEKEYAQAKTDTPEPPPERQPLTLRFGYDAARPQPMGTIVRGILHTGSLTLCYGAPKSGKSFLMTDLFLEVAAGASDWMGHRILRPGPMLYVACEGDNGFWKRLAAAAKRKGWDENTFPANFILAAGRPMLIESADHGRIFVPHPDDVLTAIENARAKGRPPMAVAVDTVFRSFGAGNVNASDHMNAYLGAIRTITDTGIGFVAVHHETKSGGTPAGSVTLIGGADTIIATQRHGNRERSWCIEFAKDDAETKPRKFTLVVEEVGTDQDGEPVSSCVVVDGGVTEQPKQGRPKKQTERDLLMRFLGDTLTEKGLPPDKGMGAIPLDVSRVVDVDHWREKYMEHTGPGENPESKARKWRRLLQEALTEGRYGCAGKWVWVNPGPSTIK
jgi:hypothetical protein